MIAAASPLVNSAGSMAVCGEAPGSEDRAEFAGCRDSDGGSICEFSLIPGEDGAPNTNEGVTAGPCELKAGS